MRCVILFVLFWWFIEHPIVEAIAGGFIDAIKSILIDHPVMAGFFVATIILCVIFAFLKQLIAAIASGIV